MVTRWTKYVPMSTFLRRRVPYSSDCNFCIWNEISCLFPKPTSRTSCNWRSTLLYRSNFFFCYLNVTVPFLYDIALSATKHERKYDLFVSYFAQACNNTYCPLVFQSGLTDPLCVRFRGNINEKWVWKRNFESYKLKISWIQTYPTSANVGWAILIVSNHLCHVLASETSFFVSANSNPTHYSTILVW